MQYTPCLLVLLLLQLAAQVLGLSTIASFSDSACTIPDPNMAPNTISFDATSPQCLLIRNDSLIPTVASFHVVFYNSSGSCNADTPVVIQYKGGDKWPASTMPMFPSPSSNQNMTFCFKNLESYGLTTLLNLNMTTLPGARTSQGLVGGQIRFLCPLGQNQVTFQSSDGLSPSHPSINARAFVQYPIGASVKFGLPMYNSSSTVPFQEFEKQHLSKSFNSTIFKQTFTVPELNFFGFGLPAFQPPSCYGFFGNNCTLPLYSFEARFGSVFPRKQRLLRAEVAAVQKRQRNRGIRLLCFVFRKRQMEFRCSHF